MVATIVVEGELMNVLSIRLCFVEGGVRTSVLGPGFPMYRPEGRPYMSPAPSASLTTEFDPLSRYVKMLFIMTVT
jgi:hypothetical protein